MVCAVCVIDTPSLLLPALGGKYKWTSPVIAAPTLFLPVACDMRRLDGRRLTIADCIVTGSRNTLAPESTMALSRASRVRLHVEAARAVCPSSSAGSPHVAAMAW